MPNLGGDSIYDIYPNTNVGFDTSGRALDMDAPNLASGYYMYGENPEDSSCPDSLRAGKMVIKGAGEIPTCAGRIETINLPDIYILDYRFKTIIRLMMIATIILMLVAILK